MPGLQEPAGGPRRVRDFTWGSHSLPPTHKGAAVSLYQTIALRVANSSSSQLRDVVEIPANTLKRSSEDRQGHSIPTICKYYKAIWLETGSSQRQWPSAIVYGSPWICSRALGGTRGTQDLPDSTACL